MTPSAVYEYKLFERNYNDNERRAALREEKWRKDTELTHTELQKIRDDLDPLIGCLKLTPTELKKIQEEEDELKRLAEIPWGDSQEGEEWLQTFREQSREISSGSRVVRCRESELPKEVVLVRAANMVQCRVPLYD